MGNKDFFKEKKEWSKFKDGLLGYYLTLYFQKILFTGKKTLYLDCFAGKGFFDDGEKGSPIIAYDIAIKSLSKSTYGNKGIKFVFIESLYFEELKKNTVGYRDCRVIESRYQDVIDKLIQNAKGYNVFLYVDPFGVKDLIFSKYKALKKTDLNSVEMLLNFNSNGFNREAKRLLYSEDTPSDEVSIGKNSIENMNKVANGTYWQEIIHKTVTNEIIWSQAEELLVLEYCKQLKTVFKYVLQIPIREKLHHIPKYRLIYATNHKVGYVEMATNMNKKWNEMRKEITNGQTFLFDIDTNNYFSKYTIEEKVLLILSDSFVLYVDVLVNFINRFGPSHTYSQIGQTIKKLETEKKIIIFRKPELTKTLKQASWISFKDKKKVMWVKKWIQ